MPARPARKSDRLSKKRQNKTSWKKKNKRVLYERKFQKVLVTFVALLISTSLIGGGLLYKKVTQPFVSADSQNSSNLFSQDINSVAIVSLSSIDGEDLYPKQIKLNIYSKNNLQTLSIDIPTSTQVDMPGKFGDEPLYNALVLGKTVNNDDFDSGMEFFIKTLESNLRFNIDRYVIVEDSLFPVVSTFLYDGDYETAIHLLLESSKTDLNSVMRTNLTPQEFYQLYKVSLNSNVPEKYEIKNQDLTSAHKKIQDVTFNSLIANERKSVSVLNGAGVSNLATYGSQVVENAGGRVISVENSRKSYEETILIVDDPTSATTKYLVRYFDVVSVIPKEDAFSLGFDDNQISRSDITIILGFDFASRL